MSSEYAEEVSTNRVRASVQDAKLRMDDAVRQFSQASRLSDAGGELVASEQLHTSVIDVWWRLRNEVHGEDGWEHLGNISHVDADVLFAGIHPQTGEELIISGLEDLFQWINRTVTVPRQMAGPNQSAAAGQREIPVRLPAIAALRAAAVLDHHFQNLGLGFETDGSRPIYHAGKMPEQEYPDPVVDGIPKPEYDRLESVDGVNSLRESKLYHDWYRRVACGNPNDYMIAISADPRTTGVSGSGKTTLGGGLAKNWFDHSEHGFDADVQYTLDAAKLAYEMYNETGEMAVLMQDEAQGTPATTGLNAKRSQKTEAIDAENAVAAGRSDRKTIIFIVQDLSKLSKGFITYIDSWLLIRDDFDYVATHYNVAPEVYDLESNQTKTPGIEQITWDALPEDDDDYQIMEEKKEQAKQGEREYSSSSDQSAGPQEERNEAIRELADTGMSQSDIADVVDLDQSTVSRIINEKN